MHDFFVVKFEEHRFNASRGIALLIFLTNVSDFSREFPQGQIMEK